MVYEIVNERYMDLLYGDAEVVFQKYQAKFSKENFEKMKELYNEYKKKYQAYL